MRPILVEQSLADPQEAGFTLVELIITIVLIGIIAGVAAMLILQGVKGYSDEEIRSDLTNQARLAIERMAREIREARDCTDITSMAPGTFTFTGIDGVAVTFTTSGANLTRNGTTLASDVSALDFAYLRRSGAPAGSAAQIWNVDVTLTVNRSGESHTHRIRVHPRGFLPNTCG